MIIWRIGKKPYIKDISGAGGKFYQGRWHHRGIEVIYAASSLELAILENLLNQNRLSPPEDYAILPFIIPNNISIKRINLTDLPSNWNTITYNKITQDIGTAWLESMDSCILETPSVPSPYGKNYLINPRHTDFPNITFGVLEDFYFDPRLYSEPTWNKDASRHTSQENLHLINMSTIPKKHDVFICHASEDKLTIVEPLVARLKSEGINVWFDKTNIKWGDSITEKVNAGLKDSEYVLVVLSANFLRKNWPKREMNAALNLEASLGRVKVLPLVIGSDDDFNNITQELALQNDKLFLRWSGNYDEIVGALKERLS